MDAITINGLSKQYNKKYAIENVSLQVAEGDFWLYRTKWCGKINDHQSIVEFYQTRCRQRYLDEIAKSSQRDQNVYWVCFQ